MFLRQSTASQEIILGPFLDDTDGKTAETGLTIANTDIKLWKSGGTTESDKNSGGATHIAGGRYYAVLDDTDTNTVGMLEVAVSVSGALPVRRQFYILEEAVYDQLFAGSAAGYQVPIWSSSSATVNLSGTTIKTATDIESDTQDLQSRIPAALVGGRIAANAEVVSDKTDYSLLANTGLGNQTANITGNLSGSVGSVTGSVGSVTSPVAVSDKTGFKLASDGLALVTSWTVDITGSLSGSVGSISGVTFPAHFNNLVISANGHVTATVDSINNNAITASSIQANALTAAKFAADSITASALATDAVNEIANAVAATQALSRLDSMIESDGAGQFRFDTIAVSLASQGGGGGAVNISVEDQSITVC